MGHYRSKKQNKTQSILVVSALVLLAALFVVVYLVQKKADSEIIDGAGTSWNADHSSEYIVFNDVQYPLIRHLSTVLLIGTDKFDDFDTQDGLRNHSQSDFLVILAFDHDKKTVTPFQFNRDTICEVSWLDENGKIGGYNTEHLAFAHTYGSGREDSCINTVNTVRRLIYNAPVDHYLAFTMDAVPLVNDLVGGVTVTMPEDLTELNKNYVEGATVTLKGQAALRFIRYREKIGGSNWLRMKRHQLYFTSFMDAARSAMQDNQDLVVDVFKKVEQFLCTDLSVNAISEIVEQLSAYQILDTVTPNGSIEPAKVSFSENAEGKIEYTVGFAEFHVSESSLWDCVYNVYCKKKA